MKMGLMVEGQNDLTWERWSHMLAMAERLGFNSIQRSDHFFMGGIQRDSLDSFLSFVVAARETGRIRFGPMCTNFNLRTPVQVGRMAAQIDLLSGGRFVLGLGVGWYEPELRAYGIQLPPTRERFDRLDEGIELMKALWSPGPATYRGRYYSIEDVDCRPKPESGRPLIVIGGTGERRTLLAVAKHADEWNCDGYLTPEEYGRKLSVLDRHCESVGRDPATIRRSMLVHVVTGPTQEAIDRVALAGADLLGTSEWTSRDTIQDAESEGMLVGQADMVVDRLGPVAEMGVEEVQLQHYDFGSDEAPEYISSEIMPELDRL